MKVFTRKKSYIGRKHLRRHSERHLSKLENEFFLVVYKATRRNISKPKAEFSRPML